MGWEEEGHSIASIEAKMQSRYRSAVGCRRGAVSSVCGAFTTSTDGADEFQLSPMVSEEEKVYKCEVRSRRESTSISAHRRGRSRPCRSPRDLRRRLKETFRREDSRCAIST